MIARKDAGNHERIKAGKNGEYILHVFRDGEMWEVWLNTEVKDFDGLCVGVGPSRDLAMRDAFNTLMSCAVHAQ